MRVTHERDGELLELELDEPTSWREERLALRSADAWEWFVMHVDVLPPELPRRWDLRCVGVDPFA